MDRMPTLFIPHGGGPWPLLDGAFRRSHDALEAHLRALDGSLATRPKAIVLVSAHWIEAVATVNAAAAPPLLFDYVGFPEAAYRIAYPAPGSPEVAARVARLLGAAGIASASDVERGFDHGVFVPLMVAYPEADVPVVELSLRADMDPRAHLAIGRALAPLRDEGILIAGSGMSYHNMRAFFGPDAGARRHADDFDAWLAAALADPHARDGALATWSGAPGAREAHPTPEHLVPLFVAAGAAGDDPGVRTFRGELSGLAYSGFRFGERANVRADG